MMGQEKLVQMFQIDHGQITPVFFLPEKRC